MQQAWFYSYWGPHGALKSSIATHKPIGLCHWQDFWKFIYGSSLTAELKLLKALLEPLELFHLTCGINCHSIWVLVSTVRTHRAQPDLQWMRTGLFEDVIWLCISLMTPKMPSTSLGTEWSAQSRQWHCAISRTDDDDSCMHDVKPHTCTCSACGRTANRPKNADFTLNARFLKVKWLKLTGGVGRCISCRRQIF